MNFPEFISFTITNSCNLSCKMCGQWGENGYLLPKGCNKKPDMPLSEWKKLVDEIAFNNIHSVLLRGGEPFMFPGIIELLKYIKSKGMFVSIDTNGSLLEKYAGEIAVLGGIHLTVSIDGPEGLHEDIRGMKGLFGRIKKGISALNSAEEKTGNKISKSITFTISRYSYRGLGKMPDIARELGLRSICIVPYYYMPRATGLAYEKEMKDLFECSVFSWKGFCHEESGVDCDEFILQYREFVNGLKGIDSYPYMPLTEEEYRTWFSDVKTPVAAAVCGNTEKLIDIQPDGSANFCVDFPDYIIGNVRGSTIKQLWNSQQAQKFRDYRSKKPLAVCARCGAKYMAGFSR